MLASYANLRNNIMNKTQYDNPKVGCYVDESAGSADDCNRRTIELAEYYGFQAEPIKWSDLSGLDVCEIISEIAERAVDHLNSLEARTGMCWTFEDNSLFLTVDVESAKEQVEFVSSKDQEYPPDDYQGEWLHVSDHGNATLYCRENGKDTEIWSVV